MTVLGTWEELVTVGLLGTDRRDPPELPPGPLADVVADAVRPTPQGRLLAAVAATVVAIRCGARPLAPRPLLQPPPDDPRPLLPVAAAERWRAIVTQWPLLEAEWLAVAAASGWRPAPDVLVALLRRHVRSPIVARHVTAWGGDLAAWLVDHVPDLEPLDSRQPATDELRPPPVPAELEPLLSGPATDLVAELCQGLRDGRYRWAHRAVLLNAIARCDRALLDALVAALTSGRDALVEHSEPDDAAPLSVWEALVELATMRREMLAELEPPK